MDSQIVSILNALLLSEWQARHQYEAEHALRVVAGYTHLAADAADRYQDEARHAAQLSERVVFLGGIPATDPAPAATIVPSIPSQFDADILIEEAAVQNYQAAIADCERIGDYGTRAILTVILGEEEAHLRELRAFVGQIADMTLANFLSAQV